MDIVVDRETPLEVGLSAILVTQSGTTHRAGVILIGGSEGGLHEHDAIALAQQGFTVLALAYFGAQGVPSVLKDIPLEYFSRAIDFLMSCGVTTVGFLGGSRGGEAALLVASNDPRVQAVVSIVGSGVVTQGIDYSLGSVDRIMGTPTVAWTINGEPLPALPNHVTPDFAEAVSGNSVVALGTQYAVLPTDPEELDRISIPIERSQAAVLMIAAEQDAMWNSPAYHAVAAERLARAAHPRLWEHIVLPGAGHSIAGPPGEPFTSSISPGPGGVKFDLGGDPAITTRARAEAWQRTVAFLTAELQPI